MYVCTYVRRNPPPTPLSSHRQIFDADGSDTPIPPPPTPKWESFYMENPGDSQGELLVSLQLIHMASPDIVLPPPPSLVPTTRSVRRKRVSIIDTEGG